jgi:glutathione S-transferase
MKLYYAPGACSLAPHIVAREAGLPLRLEKVDLAARRTETGEDFAAINPKGYVPALRLEDDEVLTEAAVLVQVVADRAPAAGLVPPHGTIERYRLQEWLNFIATELHKGFGPLWYPKTPAETREAAKAKLASRFAFLDGHFAGRAYLTGDAFSAADAYLFTILNWAGAHKLDLAPYGNLTAYVARVAARPAVQEAMRAEGLLKQAA